MSSMDGKPHLHSGVGNFHNFTEGLSTESVNGSVRCAGQVIRQFVFKH